MICIYAVAKVRPGCREQFLKAADRLINYSRAEAGNIKYHLAKESENRYVFMEFWSGEEAVQQHMKAAHFAEAGKTLESLLEEPLDIHKMEAVF
ncbi:MAG: antibiotic biosynthesis monooxygenase [Lachnospiraceae bacterium]|nr:antibiotic biosynthesis monooxygenase [Lachnospiraceae bacterium]